MDHYQTLGLPKTASQDEIKKAYRKLASAHHPDKGGDTKKFQEIQAAYDVLGDPTKREQYDNPPMHQQFRGGPEFDFAGGMNLHDLFREMHRRAGGEGNFGFGNQKRTMMVRTMMRLSLEEAYAGGKKVITLAIGNKEHTVSVEIPQGTVDGEQIRIEDVIPDVTLLVQFVIVPHPTLEQRGLDIFTKQNVSVLDLIAGGSLLTKTVSGKTLEINIKPNTQPDQVLRVAGEGMKRGNQTGNHFVLINPVVPAKIDQRIIDAINLSKGK